MATTTSRFVLHTERIGRDDEWLRLLEAVGRVEAGEGQLVHLVGPAGIGKSRLIHDLSHEVKRRDLPLHAARIESYSMAFGPVLDVIDQWVDSSSLNALSEEAGWSPSELARVETLLRNHDADSSAHGEQGGGELAEALRKALLPDSMAAPRAIFLDDFQLADPACRELISEIAGRIHAHPILIVVAERAEGQAFSRGRGYVRLELKPLSPDECAVLVEDLVDVETLPPGLVERLAESAAGSPFYLIQVVQGWATQGMVELVDERFRFVGTSTGFSLPEKVERVIEEQLLRLAPADLHVLRFVACVSGPADLRLLLRALESPPGLDDSLGRLVERGFIVGSKTGFRLTNALLGEVVQEDIPLQVKQELHRRAATVMSQTGAPPEVLAKHWLLAGEPARALPHVVAAAERDRIAYQLESASDRYHQALVLLDDGDDPRRNELLEAMGDVMRLRGELAEADAAYQQVPDVGGPVVRATRMYKRAVVAQGLGRYGDAVALCTAAIPLAEADSPLLAGRLESVASHSCSASGQLDRAADLATAGFRRLTLARGHDDPERDATLAALHRARGIVFAARGQDLQAAGEYHNAAELAGRAGDRSGEATALLLLGEALGTAGRYEAGRHFLQRAAEITTQTGDNWAQARLHRALAAISLAEGNVDEAQVEAFAGLALSAAVEDPRVASQLQILMGQLALAEGDPESAAGELEGGLAVAAEVGAFAEQTAAEIGLAWVGIANRAFADAEKVAARAEQRARAAGASEQLAEALLVAAEALRGRGERDEARETLVEALHHCQGARLRARLLEHLEKVEHRFGDVEPTADWLLPT